ncbi:MAG: protein kinase, partial [Thermodesulfobacteriota bacterium]
NMYSNMLKLSRAKRLNNLDRIERLKKEIEAVRSLSHEYIVKLIDFDLEAKRPNLVTEYCEGGSLSEAEPIWQMSPDIAFKFFNKYVRV